MSSDKILDISWWTIFKVGVFFLGFYVLYFLRDIIVLIVFSLIISVLFDPPISFLQRKGVNRILSTGLIFVLVFGFLGLSVYLVSLTFISEIRQLAQDFSLHFERLSPPLRGLGLEAFEDMDVFFASLERWLKGASSSILSALSAIFGGVFSGIFVFFLAFFFALEEKGVEKIIRALFPRKYEDLALNIWTRSQQKISGWFGVRLLTSAFVGLATFLTLKIFKIDYAISFGLFAGITNLIPYLGPLFAGAVIAVLVMVNDWLKGVFVLIAFFLIQQVEGNILNPILTKKVIGMPASLVLISLIVGGKLFGLLGVLLAIPLIGILFDFLKEFLAKRKTREA